MHVTDIGADYVTVSWDVLVPPSGNHVVTYEALCVDADSLTSVDDNHTEASSSSSSSSSLSVLTSAANATFSKLTVSAKYVIKVHRLVFHFVRAILHRLSCRLKPPPQQPLPLLLLSAFPD